MWGRREKTGMEGRSGDLERSGGIPTFKRHHMGNQWT